MKFIETYRIEKGMPTHKIGNKIAGFHSTLTDGMYTMTIEKQKDTKTLEQNRYFNGVLVTVFMKSTGYTFRDCKEFLKREFGDKEIVKNPITGEQRLEPISQAKLSLKQTTSLIERSEQFLRHDLGFKFPTLEEYKAMSEQQRSALK
jgi:hypothetical protein